VYSFSFCSKITIESVGSRIFLFVSFFSNNFLPISLDPAGTQIRIVLEQPDVNIISSLPISLDPAGTQVRIVLEQPDVNIISSLPISLDPAGTQIRVVLEQPDVDIVDVLSGRSAQYRIQR
jgi:hypothetical protein